eukprot:1182180-Prorocentrum_minimum.AAC.1
MNRLMCTSSRSGRNAWVTSSWWKGSPALPPPPGNLVSQLGVRCQAAHESTSAKLNWLNTLGTAEVSAAYYCACARRGGEEGK